MVTGTGSPVARRQERSTLSLLRLGRADRQNRRGSCAGSVSGHSRGRRCHDQDTSRSPEQSGKVARTVRDRRHARRLNSQNAWSIGPSCRCVRQLTKRSSEARSGSHRESEGGDGHARDRWFESASLQRRVGCELIQALRTVGFNGSRTGSDRRWRAGENCGVRSPRNDAIGTAGTLALLTARPPPEKLIRFRVKAYAISR
jgi:hypothetical protein